MISYFRLNFRDSGDISVYLEKRFKFSSNFLHLKILLTSSLSKKYMKKKWDISHNTMERWQNGNGSRTIHQKSPPRLNGFTRSYVDRRICNFYEWSPFSFPPSCPVLGIRSPSRSLTRLIVKHSHRDRYCSPMVENIFQCLITRICGTICRWHRSTRMCYAYNGSRK